MFGKTLRTFRLAVAAFLIMAAAALGTCLVTEQAHAADPTEAITLKTQVDGVTQTVGTFTYANLVDAGLINSDTIGGLYKKPGEGFYVVGGKNYVKVGDLIEAAGVPSTIWKSGAVLHYTCDDGDYTKYETPYEKVVRDQYFFPATTLTTAVTSPALPTYCALAFDNAQVKIPAATEDSTPTAADALASITNWATTPRIVVGMLASEVDDSGENMGKRMPGGVDTITIVYNTPTTSAA